MLYSSKLGSGHPGYLGHPGHILSGSSGYDPLYKYLDLTQILYWITCIANIDDGDVEGDVIDANDDDAQDISKRVHARESIVKKNTKGSRV